MSHDVAMEQQAAALAYYRTEAGRVHHTNMHRPLWRDAVGPRDFERGMYNDLVKALAVASPYSVAATVTPLIAAAARNFPPVTVTRDMFPSPAGFAWFDGLITLANEQVGMVDIGGFLWHLGGNKEPGALTLALFGRDYQDFRSKPCLLLQSAWIVGASTADSMLDGMQLCFALAGFMRQRLLVTHERPVASRQARKRIARSLHHEPVVRVVELRARDYQQRDESRPGDVEYTCQWLVRGHWHQYHTREGLQPRWVMPYVKGPSDKPLRVAEKVAYEVIR